MIVFKGECKGVRVDARDDSSHGGSKKHAVVTLLTEDDENWHDGQSFDSAWLDELIDVLTLAQKKLRTVAKKGKYGYDFK